MHFFLFQTIARKTIYDEKGYVIGGNRGGTNKESSKRMLACSGGTERRNRGDPCFSVAPLFFAVFIDST